MIDDATGPADDEAFRTEARAWLEAHARRRSGVDDWSDGPAGEGADAARAFFERGRAWQRTLADHGWAGIDWPVELGGRGLTPWHAVLFAQEQAAFDVTSGFVGSTIGMIGSLFMVHGTLEQQVQFLPRLLRGDDAWCQLFSEPGAGSDLANIATRAVRHGEHWVLDGQKVWTSNAQHCEWGAVLARTDVDAAKHHGITCFVIRMDTPGVEVRPIRQITGAEHFNEVFLTGVRVPHEHVVGGEHKGWAVARTVLGREATMVGSTVNGANAAALVELARATGRASDAVVRQWLAQAHIEERILGFMGDRVLASMRAGVPGLHGSVLKLFWSEAKARRDEWAVSLLGAGGMLWGDDSPRRGWWQAQLCDRFWATVGGGTSEIHRTMIGEAVAGLPPEPRVDRGIPYRELASRGLT